MLGWRSRAAGQTDKGCPLGCRFACRFCWGDGKPSFRIVRRHQFAVVAEDHAGAVASFKRNLAFAEKTAAAAAREKKRKEEEEEEEEEEEDGARLLSLWAQASLDDQRVCGINVLHIGSGPDKQRADKDFSDGSQSVPFRFSAEIYCVVQFP